MSLKRNPVVDITSLDDVSYSTSSCRRDARPISGASPALVWWRLRKRLQAIASRYAIPIEFVDQVMAAYQMKL